MKIICTKREYNALNGWLLYLADCSKVAINNCCPLGYEYCRTTPLGDIEPPMCRQCYVDNIIWKIKEEDNENS